VKIDPNFGPAWATRAQAFCEYAHFGGGPPVELFDRSAEPSLEKALSINSDDPVALAIRGMVNRDYRWKFAEAYNDLHRAIALDPNYTLAHRILSSLYYSDGKFSEAVEEQKKAVDLNPTGIIDKWFLADLLVNVGRTEEGVNLLHQLTEIDPSSTAAYYSLWRFYHSQHDEIRAFENFLNLNKAAGASPAILKSLRTTYANKGWKQVLKSELERARSSDPPGRYSHSKVYIARLATMLGEKDLAFAYLEEGRRFHDLEFCTVKVDPNFASLRSDPRFAELIKRSGI
jgi:tetratricopeptide (TPR) repeat protein